LQTINEIIAIKSELKILADKKGKVLRDYHIEVINDELVITDEDGDLLIRVLRAGYVFKPVLSTNYLYFHHNFADRVSCNDTQEKLKSRRRVCEKLIESYQANGENIPLVIQKAICERLDKIALSNWIDHRDICKGLLVMAKNLLPDYPRSGSLLERSLRRLFGIGVATRTIMALRSIRGLITGKRI